MEELQIQSGELLFNSKQKGQVSAAHSRSKAKNAKELFCNTFIYEPENINEKPLGNLYMVGEIELPAKSKQHNSSYIINLIASIVKREYYSNPKRSSLESMESALNKANYALSDFAENGNIDWMHHLHFIIATIAGNKLHLTQTGYAKSLLLREEEITDIGKTLPPKEKTLNPLKTFLHVASGTIEANDKIIFATPELFNILSLEKLRRIIVLGNTESNIKEIQKLIEESDTTSALGVLMIETPTASEPKIIKQGIEQIAIGEEERLNLQDIINEESEQEITPPSPQASDIFFNTIKELGGKSYKFIKKHSIPALKTLKSKTIDLSKKAKQKISRQPIEINNEEPIDSPPMAPPPKDDEIENENNEIIENDNFPDLPEEDENGQNNIRELINKVKNTPKKNKIFVCLTAAIIFIFFISTYISSQNKQKENLAKQAEIEAIINNTQSKINDAENSLPKNNSELTSKLLADAMGLITKLQNKDEINYSSTLDEFTQQIKNIENKLNKVVIIENPKPIGSVLADAQKCAKIENTFYCYGISQNSLYKLDINSGKMTMMDLGVQNSEQFEAITSIEHLLILLTKKPGIVVYNTANDTSNIMKLNISDPIVGMASYLKYLYLLSSKNEIIKVSGAAAGEISTSKWIKDNIEHELFTNAISIDGDVYVANTNGSISKYTQGSFINNFNISIVEALNSPEIITNKDLENLYLLDKTTQKIIISDKTGNLINQLVIPEFDNIKNIFVDNDNTLYILNKDKIYQINF